MASSLLRLKMSAMIQALLVSCGVVFAVILIFILYFLSDYSAHLFGSYFIFFLEDYSPILLITFSLFVIFGSALILPIRSVHQLQKRKIITMALVVGLTPVFWIGWQYYSSLPRIAPSLKADIEDLSNINTTAISKIINRDDCFAQPKLRWTICLPNVLVDRDGIQPCLEKATTEGLRISCFETYFSNTHDPLVCPTLSKTADRDLCAQVKEGNPSYFNINKN